MPDDNGTHRLDRIERILEAIAGDHAKLADEHLQFQQEHKQLLAAQVVLTDRLDRFILATTEAQKHTDERLNALITIVDGIIRNRPPQSPPQ